MAAFKTVPAPDIHQKICHLVEVLEFTYIDPQRIHCIRSQGSTSQAYSRIWELPRVWQEALAVPAQYIIEVLVEHFDKEIPEEQIKILIHELLHIPKTFSGALRNHRGQGEPINDRTVSRYYQTYRTKMEPEVPVQLPLEWL